MTIAQALHDLGARCDTLSAEEKAQLDHDGFLLLRGVLTPAQVEFFRARLDELLEAEGEEAGHEAYQEAGTQSLADLVNKDLMFQLPVAHPRVLAGAAHVLHGDLKLSSLNARFALPGAGLQELHADWEEAIAPDDFVVCNSIWLLDEFTSLNGATRLVPGTHRGGRLPRETMADPMAPHPDERLLLGPAGTVAIFNAHLWHGGTLNRSALRRRAMHAYFCRRDQPQQTNQRHHLRPETTARLSEAARCILDV